MFTFQPLRLALQNVTDRYLYRGTYRESELLSRISTSMNSTLDQQGLAALLSEELSGGMRLGFAGVAYLCGGRPKLVASSGLELSDAEMLLFMAGDTLVVTDEVEPGAPGYAELVKRDIRVLAPLSPDDSSLGVLILGPKLSVSRTRPRTCASSRSSWPRRPSACATGISSTRRRNASGAHRPQRARLRSG